MSTTSFQRLTEAGMAELSRGNRDAACDLFRQVIASGNASALAWLGYARCCEEAAERLRAVDSALALEPHNLRALIMKGDLLADGGDLRAAAAYYLAVEKVAPTGLSSELAGEVARARAAAKQCSEQFASHLEKQTAAGVQASPRFAQSIDLLLGRKQIFLQQPKHYYFPELPQIQFYPREALPFLDHVELVADDIRAELQAVISQGDFFAPYVEQQRNRPALGETDLMVNNPNWGALYLWKDGAIVRENAERFPKTLAALEEVPLTQIRGRAPSVLFSLLRPRTRIPPHHGFINTRLICHLPLIVPGNCGLRVGNETRQVVEGKAWAFDDTIEHEAWNNSDQPRIILLFDAWRPELTEIERESVAAMFEAIDAYGGGSSWHD